MRLPCLYALLICVMLAGLWLARSFPTIIGGHLATMCASVQAGDAIGRKTCAEVGLR